GLGRCRPGGRGRPLGPGSLGHSRRPGPGGHRGLRPGHLPQGLDRPAARPAQYQRADEHRRHRGPDPGPMGRGSHGDGPVHPGRADRGALAGPRSPGGPGPAAAGAGSRHRPPARRTRAGDPGGRRRGRHPGAHAAPRRPRPGPPDRATVLQPDGQWRETPAAGVVAGTLVRTRPGERIALDGRVVSGRSAVDQSPITGESLPVDKAEGDPVYAGTINGSGTLEYRVLAPAGETTLARIIRASESAQSARAPTQRFVDRFARIYTPLVVLLALGVALLPLLLGLGGWYDWIYRALVLLVIACPCALVISTPVSIVSGLAAAARHGVLIKGGAYLEQGRRLRWLALDKTGTLTRGQPTLTDTRILGPLEAGDCHARAAALAGCSDHPVSLAVARGLDEAACGTV